ncbi:MAG: GNAT family N-acetyltransferase [bacterium]
MTSQTNEFGQPVGPALPHWQGACLPPRTTMSGRLCRVEPLQTEIHATDLFRAFSKDTQGRLWTYMSYGPFATQAQFTAWVDAASRQTDPLFHAIVDETTGKALGLCAFLRIKPDVGVIEVGSITFAPELQQTAMATEAMFLMMSRVFDELGYRRYEWKCDALNAPSRQAAVRLGFTFEGTFAQAAVYKGRSRDTAWYAMLDHQWPALKTAYLKWLDPKNFDARGVQIDKLNSLLTRADPPG